MLRVLFIIHHLRMGGAEAIVTNYAIQLKKMGVDIAVIDIWHYDTILYNRLKKANIPVYHVLSNDTFVNKIISHVKSSDKYINSKINAIIKDYQPDVVHLHTFLDNLHLNKELCKKWFFTLHSDLNRFLTPFSNIGIENFYYQLSSGLRVFALTEKAKQDILAFNSKTQVTVIPNGLDIKGIQLQKYDKGQLLRELDLPKDTFILGHVGRFYKVKNHEKLIRIFRCVLQKNPHSALLLIGDGDKKDRLRVHGLVEEYSLQKYVRFLGVRQDATALMSCFDAMALPSFQESFSLVLVEAQAQGVRCVASDTVPDDVICTDNCFKLSVDDSDEKWAELLLATNRGNNTSCLYRFDSGVIIKKLLDVYENVKF